MLALRRVCPNDGPALHELLVACYGTLLVPHYGAGELAAMLPIITRVSEWLLGCETYYVVEEDGAAVGCGGWTPGRPGRGEEVPGLASIRHVGVHPQHTRRGIGRMICNECERTARLAGIERFECQAALGAEPFYAALGFAILGPIEVPLAGGVIMRSTLMLKALW